MKVKNIDSYSLILSSLALLKRRGVKALPSLNFGVKGQAHEALTRLGVYIASEMPEKMKGEWCFFAGFAFIIHGLGKKTNDIDILTKSNAQAEALSTVLDQKGLLPSGRMENVASFLDPVSKLSVDIVNACVGRFVPRGLFWRNIEWVKIDNVKLPTASKIDLIILKAITFHMRKENDPKKTTDVNDAKELIARYKISYDDVLSRAQRYNTTVEVHEFLKVVKRSAIQFLSIDREEMEDEALRRAEERRKARLRTTGPYRKARIEP